MIMIFSFTCCKGLSHLFEQCCCETLSNQPSNKHVRTDRNRTGHCQSCQQYPLFYEFTEAAASVTATFTVWASLTIIIIIIIIINLIYIAQFDTNGILTALYIVITYIQMQYVHV